MPTHLAHGRVEGVAPLNQKDLKRYRKMLVEMREEIVAQGDVPIEPNTTAGHMLTRGPGDS